MKVDINVRDNDQDNSEISVKIINDQEKTSKDTHDNYSGRLVDYPSDSDGTASTEEGPRDLSPRPSSPPTSPSPSPTQRRRNEQGEAVLNSFSSRGILYLLGESLRRELETCPLAPPVPLPCPPPPQHRGGGMNKGKQSSTSSVHVGSSTSWVSLSGERTPSDNLLCKESSGMLVSFG